MKRRFFNKLLAAIPFLTTASFAGSKQSNAFEKRGIWEYYNLDEYQFSNNSSLHTPEVKEGSIISVFKNNVKIPLMQHHDIDDVKENMEKTIPKYIEKRCIWIQSKNKHGFFVCYTPKDLGYTYEHALRPNEYLTNLCSWCILLSTGLYLEITT